ncbi:formyltetrahydrofolate deformylase [Brevibacterium yomogidense]|uniref:formyltetrahydrofolate deformylase n=1 Tax=Brevibacterium yomogidense TaxID=946573 RepID=UPI0018DFB099|nr:formyltetrahydrofolate deformylase [Brevibacterium yomogidense]
MTSADAASGSYVLTLHCDDRPGIVAGISRVLSDHGCNVTESKTFEDAVHGTFFARFAFTVPAADGTTADAEAALRTDLDAAAAEFGMTLGLWPLSRRMPVVLMVSKWVHCLRDLLYRAQSGHLPIDVVAVVSNHEDHRSLVEWHGVPFHHVPITPDTKPAAEARLLEIVEETGAELVVLARYMQVLSEGLTERLEGRCINIHHSFLPSFKGAKPYHQAFERGVKMVGATAHYVNSDLDEGPIITQRVASVDHSYSPADLQRHGQDAEVAALTDAVKMHAEHRIILQGGRTVVLR